MHPLTRIVIVMVISFLSVYFNSLYILVGLLLVSLTLILIKKFLFKDSDNIINRIVRLIPLIILIFLVQAIFVKDGKAIITFWGFRVTNLGLHIACSVSLRLFILLFSGAWLWGITPRELKSAFRLLKLPDSLAIIVFLTIRFLPLLSEQIRLFVNQLKTRGLDLTKVSIKERLSIYLSLIVPIIGWTLKDIKYHAISLDMRGFRNTKPHSTYKHQGLLVGDYVICVLSITFMVTLLFLLGN